MRKTTKSWVRITDVPAEIQSKTFPNRSIQRYQFTSLLGEVVNMLHDATHILFTLIFHLFLLTSPLYLFVSVFLILPPPPSLSLCVVVFLLVISQIDRLILTVWNLRAMAHQGNWQPQFPRIGISLSSTHLLLRQRSFHNLRCSIQ
jgi:ABC-type proline/glycine betaine transport system permease subunit